jgi:hypothetical protein
MTTSHNDALIRIMSLNSLGSLQINNIMYNYPYASYDDKNKLIDAISTIMNFTEIPRFALPKQNFAMMHTNEINQFNKRILSSEYQYTNEHIDKKQKTMEYLIEDLEKNYKVFYEVHNNPLIAIVLVLNSLHRFNYEKIIFRRPDTWFKYNKDGKYRKGPYIFHKYKNIKDNTNVEHEVYINDIKHIFDILSDKTKKIKLINYNDIDKKRDGALLRSDETPINWRTIKFVYHLTNSIVNAQFEDKPLISISPIFSELDSFYRKMNCVINS